MEIKSKDVEQQYAWKTVVKRVAYALPFRTIISRLKNTTKSDVSVENIGLKRQGGYFPKSQPSSLVGYNM
jgi:hypothetical protein